MAAARVQHNLFRIACTGINVPGTGIREDFILASMHQQQWPWADVGDKVRAVRLATHGDDSVYRFANRPCRNDDGSAEGVSYEGTTCVSTLLEVADAEQGVEDTIDEVVRIAIVQSQRGNIVVYELGRKPWIKPSGGTIQAPAGAADPDDSGGSAWRRV
jgi:anti-sigma factor ChrR (cupin superfamily)